MFPLLINHGPRNFNLRSFQSIKTFTYHLVPLREQLVEKYKEINKINTKKLILGS